MSSSLQTVLALGVVLLAAGFLLRSWLRQRRAPGCGGNCGAVTPDVRKLKKRLARGR